MPGERVPELLRSGASRGARRRSGLRGRHEAQGRGLSKPAREGALRDANLFAEGGGAGGAGSQHALDELAFEGVGVDHEKESVLAPQGNSGPRPRALQALGRGDNFPDTGGSCTRGSHRGPARGSCPVSADSCCCAWVYHRSRGCGGYGLLLDALRTCTWMKPRSDRLNTEAAERLRCNQEGAERELLTGGSPKRPVFRQDAKEPTPVAG